ncbi:MAG TPA: tetratricopeptide repeat protein [Candidatus Hydrogenedens sp.]|nr:tetratricopeptide repeat protein [Candidatus Hydrogenedens sp.]
MKVNFPSVYIIFFSLLVITIVSTTIFSDDGLEEIVKQKQDAVLLINCKDINNDIIQGSGFCISASGYVIATAHQLKDAKQIEGKLINGDIFPLTVQYLSEEKDISILKAKRTFQYWIDISVSSKVKAGANVFTLASPDKLAFSVITGTVSNPNRLYNGNKVLQLTLYADPGTSGAPVFNKDGDLIGMIIGKLEDTVFSLAIYLEEIQEFIKTTPIHEFVFPESQTNEFQMVETEIIPIPGIDRTILMAIKAYNEGVNSTDVKKKYEYYKKSAQLLPEFFEAWFNLGVVSEMLSNYTVAEKAYKQALKISSQSVEAMRNLGQLLLKMNRLDEAETIFEQLIKLCQTSPQIYNDLGETLRRMNQLDKAEENFNKAISLDSKYALAYYNLGLIQLAKENETEAIHYFQEYLNYTKETSDREKISLWIEEMKKKQKTQ